MTAAHTPGPWQVAWSERVETNASILGQGDQIAWVESHQVGEERARANARLIAAAPDLLAALRAMLASPAGVARPLSGDEVRSLSDAVSLARAAIAKATGGEP